MLREPLPKPENIHYVAANEQGTVTDLNLLPKNKWAVDVTKHWDISEQGAKQLFRDLLKTGLTIIKLKRLSCYRLCFKINSLSAYWPNFSK